MGSLFHREGAAYLKERFVIFKEDRVDGRARVTIDEERAVVIYCCVSVDSVHGVTTADRISRVNYHGI